MDHIIDIEILSHKIIDDDKIWYLCQGNLLNYLDNLKNDFYDFAIQRRIVKNQYLDYLYQTIKSGDPIPLITLTCKKPYVVSADFKEAKLDLSAIEILDGLQRTFRLWAYKILCEEYSQAPTDNAQELSRRIKVDHLLFFDSGVLSTAKVRKLLENQEIGNIKQVFSTFDIYFIIWAGLDDKEVVEKMLQLNAGQKSVSKTHQFELLFLHFYDELRREGETKLVREKDPNASQVKKGQGAIGEFMFSSVIVALQSFVEQKPLRISTENLIGDESDDDISNEIYNTVFTIQFIRSFLKQITALEQVIFEKEKEAGKEWFVKDTTLSGLFAAVGTKIQVKEIDAANIYSTTTNTIDRLRDIIAERGLHLKDFTEEYNQLSSRAGNIGVFIRAVINEYFIDLLNERNPNWKESFNKISERNKK